ncbi:alpha/beta-hydrolase [Pilatotrama ljubarskyi]|nr:alpha/beta-hydrolase [Pilatotrama ljubarskyi]
MSATSQGSRSEANVPRDVVHLPSGSALEYVLLHVSPESKKLAVCLHPWSWLGGQMNDPVLELVTGPLLDRGYNVLRYNSRGVGKSKGWPSFTGSQEVEDLRSLLQWAMSKIPGLSDLVILGYSHGSLIASMHPVLPDVTTSHIFLSYPLGPRHWLTAFRTHRYTAALQDLIREPRSNVLIVYGDNDNFTSVESYDAWAESLQTIYRATESNAPARYGKLEVVKIAGASHFWREGAAVRRLVEVIRDWVP